MERVVNKEAQPWLGLCACILIVNFTASASALYKEVSNYCRSATTIEGPRFMNATTRYFEASNRHSLETIENMLHSDVT
jgi:hypothetical protein